MAKRVSRRRTGRRSSRRTYRRKTSRRTYRRKASRRTGRRSGRRASRRATRRTNKRRYSKQAGGMESSGYTLGHYGDESNQYQGRLFRKTTETGSVFVKEHALRDKHRTMKSEYSGTIRDFETYVNTYYHEIDMVFDNEKIVTQIPSELILSNKPEEITLHPGEIVNYTPPHGRVVSRVYVVNNYSENFKQWIRRRVEPQQAQSTSASEFAARPQSPEGQPRPGVPATRHATLVEQILGLGSYVQRE